MFSSGKIEEVSAFLQFLNGLEQPNTNVSEQINQEYIVNAQFHDKLIKAYEKNSFNNVVDLMFKNNNKIQNNSNNARLSQHPDLGKYPPMIRDLLMTFEDKIAIILEKMLGH